MEREKFVKLVEEALNALHIWVPVLSFLTFECLP